MFFGQAAVKLSTTGRQAVRKLSAINKIMALQLNKVLISDEVDAKCVDILKANGIEVLKDTSLAKNTDQLIAQIKNYDGLIVRSATKVTAEIINAADNLKIIGRAGTGVDNIDINAATRKGVIVMNTPGGNTLSAAELTCALFLAVSRHIAAGTESMHAGRWDRKKFMGNEVAGKTLAIIGLGRIGEKVAERMQSFGMRTIGYDPIIPAEESAKFGVEWMPMEDLWPLADYITVHTPLIPQTKHMINDAVFAKCKKGVRVVNCARGGIIDEDALLRALNSGQCAGAGLDVFVEEPPNNTALVNHPLVTCTPHLGASTLEAQSRVATEIAEQFVDVRQGKSLFGALNANALISANQPGTGPWITLATALGKLLAAQHGPIREQGSVTLKIQGDGLAKAGSYLSAAVLTGLLSCQSNNGINLVSAPALAKETGLQVSSSYEPSGVPAVTLSAGDISLTGSVGGDTPYLTHIGGAGLVQGVPLTGSLLLYQAQAGIQAFTSMAGAVQTGGVSVQSFISTATGGDKAWSVCKLSAPLQDVNLAKAAAQSAYTVNL